MTHTRIPAMYANAKLGNMSGWQERHNDAVTSPRLGFERAIRDMIAGWIEYANAHKTEYESTIGNDGVLGDQWQAVGEGILGLLNGQTGRFDCGTLDALIRNTMWANNVEIES